MRLDGLDAVHFWVECQYVAGLNGKVESISIKLGIESGYKFRLIILTNNLDNQVFERFRFVSNVQVG